jgi:sugar phosphate isomerase/epimerase
VRRLSLAQLTLEPVTAPELVAAAAAAGFEAVTIRLLSPPGFEQASPGSERPIPVAAIRRALQDAGIGVLDATSLWIGPAARVADFEPALDAAAEIGAEHFTAVVTDPERQRALERFSAVCAMAAARKLKIALEFMPYSAVRTLGDAARMIEEAGQANAGILLDALHLARSGGSPADLKNADLKKISFLQLSDAPRQAPRPEDLRLESRTRRLHPGEGDLPLRALLAAVPPELPIDVEAPRAADAGLSARDKAMRAAEATRKFLAA